MCCLLAAALGKKLGYDLLSLLFCESLPRATCRHGGPRAPAVPVQSLQQLLTETAEPMQQGIVQAFVTAGHAPRSTIKAQSTRKFTGQVVWSFAFRRPITTTDVKVLTIAGCRVANVTVYAYSFI
jgi:hypothetical protein